MNANDILLSFLFLLPCISFTPPPPSFHLPFPTPSLRFQRSILTSSLDKFEVRYPVYRKDSI